MGRRQGLLCITFVLVLSGGAGLACAAPATSPAHDAANEAIGFTFGNYSGVSYGMAKELVYYVDPALTTGYYKISELNWPLEPTYYFGTRVSFSSPLGPTLSLDVRTGMSLPVGSMTDTDYLNGDGTATNFSQSDSSLQRSVGARGEVGWRFPIAGGLSLEPFFRYSFLDFKWSAQGGYYQYPPGFSSTSPFPPPTPYPPYTQDAKQPLTGLVALYEQRYSIPAIGLSAGYTFGRGAASLGLSIAYSPFASINDIDNHLLRDLIFYDSVSYCTYIEPALSFSVEFAKGATLSLDLSYLSVESPPNGTIVSLDTTTGTYSAYSDSTSGAAISVFSGNLAIGFRM